MPLRRLGRRLGQCFLHFLAVPAMPWALALTQLLNWMMSLHHSAMKIRQWCLIQIEWPFLLWPLPWKAIGLNTFDVVWSAEYADPSLLLGMSQLTKTELFPHLTVAHWMIPVLGLLNLWTLSVRPEDGH